MLNVALRFTPVQCLLLSILSAGFTSPARSAEASDTAAQIAAALLPLPESMRAGATVVSRGEGGKISVLREGSNDIVCTSDHTRDQIFYVNCFHKLIVALRNRSAEVAAELRRAGKTADQKVVFDLIDQEIKAGKLKLPDHPVMGFQMRGPLSGYNPATNTVSSEIKTWQMVEIPYATAASLSLPEESKPGIPWVMFPGTWDAHIMIEH